MKTYKVVFFLNVNDDDDSLDNTDSVEDAIGNAVEEFTGADVSECYAEEIE